MAKILHIEAIVLFFVIFRSILTVYGGNDEQHHSLHQVRQVLKSRFELLKHYAKDGMSEKKECSNTKYIIVTEIPWGRSGNLIIEMAHGLWIAEVDVSFFTPKHYNDCKNYILMNTLGV